MIIEILVGLAIVAVILWVVMSRSSPREVPPTHASALRLAVTRTGKVYVLSSGQTVWDPSLQLGETLELSPYHFVYESLEPVGSSVPFRVNCQCEVILGRSRYTDPAGDYNSLDRELLQKAAQFVGAFGFERQLKFKVREVIERALVKAVPASWLSGAHAPLSLDDLKHLSQVVLQTVQGELAQHGISVFSLVVISIKHQIHAPDWPSDTREIIKLACECGMGADVDIMMALTLLRNFPYCQVGTDGGVVLQARATAAAYLRGLGGADVPLDAAALEVLCGIQRKNGLTDIR